MLSKLMHFIKSHRYYLYGELNDQEFKKFLLFAVIFAFTIGGYWFLAPLKDSIFFSSICNDTNSLGRNIAIGKWISTLCLFALLPFYSFLIDRLQGHKVFYGICIFYITGILFFALFFKFKLFFADYAEYLELNKIISWSWYVFVESFGAFLPVVFWSFVSDHALPNEAKSGYSMIALGGVIGGILGPLVVNRLVLAIGTANVMFIAALWISFIPLLLAFTVRSLGTIGLKGYQSLERKPRPGFTEGIKLLIKNKYLLAIFAAIAFNEITQVLIDIHFKTYARKMFTCSDSLANFFSIYALCVNGLALICLLLRIDLLGIFLGVKKSLILLPILVGLGIIILLIWPSLYTAFIAIVATKAFNFAFNQPSKEQLYIPTTPTSKYKAKAWIDIFGYQSSRALGWAMVGYQGIVQPLTFLFLSSGAGLLLVIFWIFIAYYVGGEYQKAIKNNITIC